MIADFIFNSFQGAGLNNRLTIYNIPLQPNRSLILSLHSLQHQAGKC